MDKTKLQDYELDKVTGGYEPVQITGEDTEQVSVGGLKEVLVDDEHVVDDESKEKNGNIIPSVEINFGKNNNIN